MIPLDTDVRLVLDSIFDHWIQATITILTNVVLDQPIWLYAPTADAPPSHHQQPMYSNPAPAPASYPVHYSMYGYPYPFAQPAQVTYPAQDYYAPTGKPMTPAPSPAAPLAALSSPPPFCKPADAADADWLNSVVASSTYVRGG